MMINLCILLFVLIKCSLSKMLLLNYPLVNLIENSPLNSVIVSLNSSMNGTKYVLLNLNGFETNKFEIKNENILIKNEIDREEFVNKNYCLNNNYCSIELHIIVNDGLEYIIIPIHIIE